MKRTLDQEEVKDSEAKKPKVEYTRSASASNEAVGIIQYMNEEITRYNCVLKGRFSDFVVREVWGDDACVLKDMNALSEEGEPDELGGTAAEKAVLGYPALQEAGIPEESIETLKKHINPKSGFLHCKEGILLTSTELDKAQRTALHKTIKKYFPKLASYSENGLIKVKTLANTNGRSVWPKGRGSYVHFTLYKENIETGQCLKALASKLHVNHKTLSTAGTKDKRAITAQRVSAYRITTDKLAGLNSTPFGKGAVVRVGDFCYKDTEVKLGMHSGNRFSIVLRNFTGKQEEIEVAMQKVAAKGFINYFGLQRFGTTSIPTHMVAIHILEGDMKKALDTILQSKAEVVKEFQPAVDHWRETPGDISGVLEKAPHWCLTERTILQALSGYPGEYIRAFEALPRNTRSLYFHALQSLVWNEMVSKRTAQHGLQPIEGDLVVTGKGSHGSLQAVMQLTADDVASGNYTLADVVMPLPGCDPDLCYPGAKGCDKSSYEECLMKYRATGLLGKSNCQINPKTMNLFGGYRSVAAIPGSLTWSLTPYAEDDESLQHCEYNVTTGKLYEPSDDLCVAGFKEQPPKPDGPLTALRVSFTLKPSAYATMFLREVVDCTTCNA
eukprot:TRINITY_DN21240_c0_g1_i1.p1 TRINITY_DN21240_c0_g1~~TRINITY_DN21240_c0_g1_i1.p1  ORF type:complete len:613 (+),score=125.99 TRINITY_DN21240_c0_g1_i1:34-1872(+)